ncbi:MAG: CAP domain-containing protein [Candidatus Liptonbacteria bacterium]|nr:CAP domain-containing protein [Candidatus Liptonbacteria bacterium]
MKKALSISALVVVFVVLFYFRADLVKVYKALPEISNNIPNIVNDIKKEISAPAPLRSSRTAPAVVLTKAGVIERTNIERQNNGGLPALKENAKLDAAAQAKLKDMFAKQYFEHVSPSGVGPGDLVEAQGYDYILAGENLALGNFAGDQDLVTAWMNSPGHRANILNNRYREIGVAVGKGMYEGRETWFAVQEFGLPLSACPSPDKTLQTNIYGGEAGLSVLKAEAENLKAELEANDPKTRKEFSAYNQKVDEYNSLVRQINVLIDELKIMVNNYNAEVQTFNLCAGN